MAAEAIYTFLRFGFLVLLWIFLFLAIIPLNKNLSSDSSAPSNWLKKRNRKRKTTAPVERAPGVRAPSRPAKNMAAAVAARPAQPETTALPSQIKPNGNPFNTSGKDSSRSNPNFSAATINPEIPAKKSIMAKLGNQTEPTKLVVVSGDQKGLSIPLTEDLIILGRSRSCQLTLTDTFSSGKHAKIYRVHQQWYLKDLNSTNGTFVNEKQIHSSVPLNIGVPVRIGQTILELI